MTEDPRGRWNAEIGRWIPDPSALRESLGCWLIMYALCTATGEPGAEHLQCLENELKIIRRLEYLGGWPRPPAQ